MERVLRRQALVLAALACLAGGGAAVALWRRAVAPEPAFVLRGRIVAEAAAGAQAAAGPAARATPAERPPSADRTPPDEQAPPEPIAVHVAGRVRKPGVYRLESGARADDAVRAAGGALPGADLDQVNLAARLEDGAQLYVPAASSGVSTRPAPAGRAASAAPRRATQEDGARKLTKPGEGKVNINAADERELQRLPGVGPATAARIVAHRREAGRFTAIEEMMDVSGIGEKKLAAMRPFISLR
ncbi:MAG: helix-hairpin-helix domain-containing protein [Chthonomonadales bacterium]|nr:helix-hairpin-helix domain-containing protein [Chthonomonadales bacterium]